MKSSSILFSALLLLLSSCGDEVAVPKPPVYPRIFYPTKAYEGIEKSLPYQFEKPTYSNLVDSRDSKVAKNKDAKYWKDLNFKDFNATLHLSYARISSLSQLDSLKEEARRLTYEHSFKADDIQNISISNEVDKVYGIIYLIEGNTATNLNFYLTDSSQQFFRGSLYFNAKTKPDSILPVFKFIKEDIEHLISTFQWKEK